MEINRTKNLRRDNAHITRKKGGRKNTRRFSLQPFKHRHHLKTMQPSMSEVSQELDTELSRTPEESTNSIEFASPAHPQLSVDEGGCAPRTTKVHFK